MHMNAVPRGFWNGFGNFAFPHGAHLPSQISQEMAANVTNAWSTQRSTTESVLVNQGWEQSLSEAAETNSSDNFLPNVHAQPYAAAPPCIQITTGSQYGAHTYRPSSFCSDMPFLTGNHQAQMTYSAPFHYQRPFGSQASFEAFQHGTPQVLEGGTSNTVTTLNNGGIWHDSDQQSNIINLTDVVRYAGYASLSHHDFHNWPASFGGGSGILNPATQQSTVSPQRLSIRTISSPVLSHSDNIAFWTPLPSPVNSSPSFPDPVQAGGGPSLEYLPSEVPCTQEEDDHKPNPSLRSIRQGEGLRSQTASIPFASTLPRDDWINQSKTSPVEENSESKRSLKRLAHIPQRTASTSVSREAQDDFLLRAREDGMSYKEIRRRGNFSEAESTLRGRLRALKKKPCERVRKPEWTQKDDDLLVEKVTDLSEQNWSLRSQAPWRQVSEYIWNNGGSYKFGYATCRKRWEDLNAPNDD